MSQHFHLKENIYFFCKWNAATKMQSLAINNIEITLKGNLVKMTEIRCFLKCIYRQACLEYELC